MNNSTTPSEAALIAEYSATNDAYMHYDSYSWQVGAVLIAGTFIFWGFLLGKNVEEELLSICSLLATLLMSSWILYASHNRQIYLSKLHRIHEIERMLGLKQHLRWINDKSHTTLFYRVYGLNGHQLDNIIYFVSSIGSPLIGIFKYGFHIVYCFPVLIVIIVLTTILVNEKLVRKHLESFK